MWWGNLADATVHSVSGGLNVSPPHSAPADRTGCTGVFFRVSSDKLLAPSIKVERTRALRVRWWREEAFRYRSLPPVDSVAQGSDIPHVDADMQDSRVTFFPLRRKLDIWLEAV
jgi:hypothetical protein